MKRYFLLLVLLGAILVASGVPNASAEPRWIMPRPPYPAAARFTHEQGRVKLKVTTDKTGKVVKAVASVPPKQGDVPNLARTAVQWALTHWSGPPNTIGKTEVTFVMQ